MTQTTEHSTFRNVYAEVSLDGITWTNISGTFNSLTNSGGQVQTGKAYTAEGDLPLVGIGKKDLTETELNVIYTENPADPWRKFFDAYKDGTDLRFRYAPKGNASGNLRFTTAGQGYVTTPPYPEGSVEEGKPTTTKLKLLHPGFADDTIP